MAEYVKELYSWIAFVPNMTFKNFLEIGIIAFVVYEVLVWIKNTRAWTLLKGILFICGFVLMAAVLELDTILWLLGKASYITITALIIIFQPELRKALEQLGSKNVLTGIFTADDGKVKEGFSEKTINELTRACFEMGKVKTGALMVIEMETPLTDVERTGIEVDGIITSQLLINIFEHNTPLHDGAVIVQGNRVASATCYLPLSDNLGLSKELGTRHRAGVGISEVTDSLTVIVSEETGKISVAYEGKLERNLDAETLRDRMHKILNNTGEEHKNLRIWKGRSREKK